MTTFDVHSFLEECVHDRDIPGSPNQTLALKSPLMTQLKGHCIEFGAVRKDSAIVLF